MTPMFFDRPEFPELFLDFSRLLAGECDVGAFCALVHTAKWCGTKPLARVRTHQAEGTGRPPLTISISKT